MVNPVEIKKEIYLQCLNYIQVRISEAELAVTAAKESANEDTKSSAGDKYETGREMMQQEIDRNQRQLMESKKLLLQLELLDPDAAPSDLAGPGSLVETTIGLFYISISKGQSMINGQLCYAISAVSPLGAAMLRQKAGAELKFNGKPFRILNIY